MRINWKLEAHTALSTSYSITPNSYINLSKRKNRRKMNIVTDLLKKLATLIGLVIMINLPGWCAVYFNDSDYLYIYFMEIVYFAFLNKYENGR